MSQKISVTAIGGNSPDKDKAHQSIADQYQAVNETCQHIADMTEKGWTVAIEAELLLISTAVEKVPLNFGKPEQEWIDKMTLEEAKAYLAQDIRFAKGSMAPKIQACIWFLEKGGRNAIISDPANIGRALAGDTVTRIVK